MVEKLKNVQLLTGAEELVMNFRYGGMPAATAERSMRLFASDVLPELHALEAGLPAEMAGAAATG